MRKAFLFFTLTFAFVFSIDAQVLGYTSMRNFVNNVADTISDIRIEKRKWGQMMLSSGVDYRISVLEGDADYKDVKKKYFAVLDDDGKLYVNCRTLRYKRMKFGSWFAPALRIGNRIYFSALPLGSVAGSIFVKEDSQRVSGDVGDAIATSALVNKRVCYELDCKTGKVLFVDTKRMSKLLQIRPEWQKAYLEENDQTADCAFRYIRLLQTIKF